MPVTTRHEDERLLFGASIYATEEEADQADRGWQINEYTMSREYGGPEEGGWWYNLQVPTGRSVVLHPLVEWHEAVEVRSHLDTFADLTNANDNPRGIYSVVGGDDLVWDIENHEPRISPSEQPHYC